MIHTSSTSQRSSEVGSGLGLFGRVIEALSNPFKRANNGDSNRESTTGVNL